MLRRSRSPKAPWRVAGAGAGGASGAAGTLASSARANPPTNSIAPMTNAPRRAREHTNMDAPATKHEVHRRRPAPCPRGLGSRRVLLATGFVLDGTAPGCENAPGGDPPR